MCGICGIFSVEKGPIPVDVLQKMTATLHHRGPDDTGFFFCDTQKRIAASPPSGGDFAPCVGLGHKRLSIIDLSPQGHQPMCNETESLWLTYNGEIYNYVELRRELESHGHRFRSQTDSEVLLHGFEQWGAELLPRLNGMWAFAIYDRENHRLFCARDRFGIKPFYYADLGGTFYFASELKALMEIPDLPLDFSQEKILRYLLWGLIDEDEQTMLAAVRRLRPGRYLLVDGGGIEERTYYDLHDHIDPQPRPFAENTRRFRELFADSVRLRLRSDVPVGACLSGGLDSSAIVVTMREFLSDDAAIHTFSAVFPGDDVDESRYAKSAAAQAAADTAFVTPTAEGLLQELDRVLRAQDEPFWSTAVYNHWCVMRLAGRHGLKVLLDGQGGDELLAGYHYYFFEWLAHLLVRGQAAAFVRELRALRQAYSMPPHRLLGNPLALLLPAVWRFRLQSQLGYADKAVIRRDVLRQYRGALKEYPLLCADRVNSRGAWDFFYSIPYLLRLEDRNSMAFSIETRVPFLDHRLVEFLFSVPAEQKIHSAQTKYLMRRSLKGVLPDEILQRRDKIGFFTPERLWMRTALRPLLEETFHSDSFRGRGLFEVEKVQRTFRDFLRGRHHRSHVLWRWFNLERWMQLVERRFR